MDAIIGIDFGTTNSVVSFFDGQDARVLLGDDGDPLVPSAVFIDEDHEAHVGWAARNVMLLHPESVVMSVKREIGTEKRYSIGGREYTPTEIASFIFSALRERAERRIGQRVRRAVVSVPAYFDETKRQAIKKAASLAGLEVVRLINEPTAAALGHRIEGIGNVLVYDLGGGTFDVSVLQTGEGVYRVLSSRGDAALGGDDFDSEIVEELLSGFHEETGIDLVDDKLAMHKLRVEAERAKISLSVKEEARVEIPFIAANVQGACTLDAVVSRESFEKRIRGYISRTIALTRGALNDAGLRVDEIDQVLLIGGSTRIPAIRRAIATLVGREPTTGIDPEKAVAEGAAVEGGIIAGHAEGTVLVDVTPLGLGIVCGDDEFVALLPRNSVLPAQAKAVFTTMGDYQRRARVTVLQGEQHRARENVTLGSFDLDSIEQAPRGVPEIEVTFTVDVDGLLRVEAKDVKTGSWEGLQLMTQVHMDDAERASIVSGAREAELDEILHHREMHQ